MTSTALANPQRPLVSVILTTYNRPAEFKRAFFSVLSQTLQDWELVIVDDHSAQPVSIPPFDSSLSNKITLLRNTANFHLSFSRNLGVSNSSGEYLAFLDDDDYWHPDKLFRQISYMRQSCSSASYTGSILFDSRGNYSEADLDFVAGNIFDLTLLGQPTSNLSTYIIRRDLFKQTSGFDTAIRKGVDGMFIRQISFISPISCLPDRLTYYSVDTYGGKITSDSKTALKRSLKSYRLTLVRYKRHLLLRPYHRAIIYLRIALIYMLLNKAQPSLKYFTAFIHYYLIASLLPLRLIVHSLFRLLTSSKVFS